MTRRAKAPSVLVVHDRYQQFGGEDVAVEADLALLETHGHRVAYYERDNDEISHLGPGGQARLAMETIWSRRARRDLREIIRRERPDVAHIHNTFPLISPSIYGAAAAEGVPVVQSVHNYRLLCATGALLRDGHGCTDCIGKRIPVPSICHGCYHGSRLQTAVVATMHATHNTLRTWKREVDLYLPVSDHVRRRLVEAGAIPAERALVRRNYVSPDPGSRTSGSDQGYALFAGRLSYEKGVDVLIRAAALVPQMPVRVVGDGPQRGATEELALQLGASHITFLGRLPRHDVLEQMRNARCLVMPSTWEEPMGMVLIEAAALGVPVIGSDMGGTSEAVTPDSGMLLPAGDVGRLAEALREAWSDPAGWQTRGVNARRHYEAEFTAERAYETLLAAYERVLPARRVEPVRTGPQNPTPAAST